MRIRKAGIIVVIAVLQVACRKDRPSANTVAFTPIIQAVAPGTYNPQLPRPVYPYSIVPGGIRSKEELQNAARTDSTVANHYAALNIEALKPKTLSQDATAYVSFRKGGKVYWTSRRVTLKAGEQVFQGGEIAVRGRCGNQVSDQPRQPVLENPAEEPDSETFNTAEPAKDALTNLSSRTAAPVMVPVALLDAANEERPPTPSGNLGWSAPVSNAGGESGVVASGGGGGGGGGGAGGGSGVPGSTGGVVILSDSARDRSSAQASNPPGNSPTNPSADIVYSPIPVLAPPVPILPGNAANTIIYVSNLPPPGTPVTWFQPPVPPVQSNPGTANPAPVGDKGGSPPAAAPPENAGIPPHGPGVPPSPEVNPNVEAVNLPEPASWALLISGAIFIAWKRKRVRSGKI